MVSANNSMYGDRPRPPTQVARWRGMPVKPMAIDRKAAPTRMKPIMHEVRIAPIRLVTKVARVSVREAAASASAPSTPMVAASVGVATPP